MQWMRKSWKAGQPVSQHLTPVDIKEAFPRRLSALWHECVLRTGTGIVVNSEGFILCTAHYGDWSDKVADESINLFVADLLASSGRLLSSLGAPSTNTVYLQGNEIIVFLHRMNCGDILIIKVPRSSQSFTDALRNKIKEVANTQFPPTTPDEPRDGYDVMDPL